jgi:hypothetical protein
MTDRPAMVPGPLVPLFVAFMGFAALWNTATSPTFATFRAVDVVRLVASGMCFGAALVLVILFLRGPRS